MSSGLRAMAWRKRPEVQCSCLAACREKIGVSRQMAVWISSRVHRTGSIHRVSISGSAVDAWRSICRPCSTRIGRRRSCGRRLPTAVSMPRSQTCRQYQRSRAAGRIWVPSVRRLALFLDFAGKVNTRSLICVPARCCIRRLFRLFLLCGGWHREFCRERTTAVV